MESESWMNDNEYLLSKFPQKSSPCQPPGTMLD